MEENMYTESPKTKKKWGRVLPILLVTLLTAGIAAGVVFYNGMLNKINRAQVVENTNVTVDPALLGNMEETEASMPEDTVPEITETTVPQTTEHIPSPEDILNVLVVGQAARAGEESRLADTMILVSVN